MGHRARVKVWRASTGILEAHNRHSRITFEDAVLKIPRLKRKAEVEQRDAEWMMRNRGRWGVMDQRQSQDQ